MGLLRTFKKKTTQSKEDFLRMRKENKGYKRIVREKTRLAARQAYSDEAQKVAKERARAKARAPSFGQKLGKVSQQFAQRVAQPRPIARAPARRKIGKKKTTRGYSSKKKKRTRRAPTFPAPRKQMAPASLNQAIYGGY
jgi:hypothetical protein